MSCRSPLTVPITIEPLDEDVPATRCGFKSVTPALKARPWPFWGDRARARRSDPSGADALAAAKRMRRHALLSGGKKDPDLVLGVAEEHFGLPHARLGYWESCEIDPAWRRLRKTGGRIAT